MLLLFILEETHEAYNCFRTEKWFTHIEMREIWHARSGYTRIR